MRKVTDLEQTPARPGVGVDDKLKNTGDGDGRIRCPKCGWSPRSGDRWMCACRHIWNTFDTGGVCPGCLKKWETTQCKACHQWSAHSDWYPKY